MVYCNYCACDVDVEVDDANGFSCCVQCGRVLEDTAFSADVAFQKDAAGESTVVGQFVNESGQARGLGRIHGGKIYSYQADSHEKAQARGRSEIAHLVDMLGVRPREESIEAAHRLYKLALNRNFTRGRRTNQVAAACLYLVCRQDSKPFLLIDFSDALQVNVFVLGGVFLQLAKLLRVDEHPMFNKPVDPSLYIHRFADRLGFGREMHAVANTALRLVASMKRDWIQTGRRPSGICGASLYIAAHIHGFERTKKDVVSVVHVGEATLAKRLTEFTATGAGDLTAEEFQKQVMELENQERLAIEAAQPTSLPAAMEEMGAGCEHLRLGEAHFARGMCRSCFLSFLAVSGGLSEGGANPPAFTAARRAEERAQAEAEAEVLALQAAEEEEVLALPAPQSAGEAYEREEQEIAEDMAHALEGSEMQPFAALLAHAADGGEDEAGGSTQPKKKMPVRRKQQQQQQQGQQEQQKQQQQQEQQQQQPQEQATAAEPDSQGAASTPAAAEAAATEGGANTATAHEEEAGAPPEAQQAEGATEPQQEQQQQQEGSGAAVQETQESGASAPAATAEASSAGVGAEAGAIVPHPTAGAITSAFEEEDDDGRLSDISDSQIEHYLADEAEVAVKEEIWNMMNADWLEKQAAKQAAREAAERARSAESAEAEAAAAAGIEYKRRRGRPPGSRSSKSAQDGLPPPDTPQEAALRMLDHKKLSSKINYSVLAELFEDSGAAGAGGGAGEAEDGGGDGGEGGAINAALREREAAEQAQAGARQQRQAAALEAEKGRRRVGGTGLGGLLGSSSLGLGLGSKSGGSGFGSLGGSLGSRALGTLRDVGAKSRLGGGGAAAGGGGGAKRVRFSGE